jgi:hypothetical protein
MSGSNRNNKNQEFFIYCIANSWTFSSSSKSTSFNSTPFHSSPIWMPTISYPSGIRNKALNYINEYSIALLVSGNFNRNIYIYVCSFWLLIDRPPYFKSTCNPLSRYNQQGRSARDWSMLMIIPPGFLGSRVECHPQSSEAMRGGRHPQFWYGPAPGWTPPCQSCMGTWWVQPSCDSDRNSWKWIFIWGIKNPNLISA